MSSTYLNVLNKNDPELPIYLMILCFHFFGFLSHTDLQYFFWIFTPDSFSPENMTPKTIPMITVMITTVNMEPRTRTRKMTLMLLRLLNHLTYQKLLFLPGTLKIHFSCLQNAKPRSIIHFSCMAFKLSEHVLYEACVKD